MNCCLSQLRRKEVINSKNGCRIGYVDDLEVDTHSAKVCALIIYGPLKFFGLFGRKDDCIIPWSEIELIGEDTILVGFQGQKHRKHSKKAGFFNKF